MYDGDLEEIEASDGTRVRLEVSRRLTLVVEKGTARRTVSFPYPSHGFGGHGFVLSPTERLLVFAYYSGQDEEAYEVLTFPDLEPRWSQPYAHGGQGAPMFTPDGHRLVVLRLTSSALEIVDLVERIDSGELDEGSLSERAHVLEWARVHVRDLETGAVDECRLLARMPVGSAESHDPGLWPEALSVTDDALMISLNSGSQLSIPIPPLDARIFDGPTPG